jgi:hypothetical protein
MAPENPTTPVDPPAQLYVLRQGETFGPFREEQLRKGVEEGHFSLEDSVRTEGEKEWRPLSEILGTDAKGLHGAVAPDWNSVLKWSWLRLRYSLGEQSLVTGVISLAIGILAWGLSHWPFVFWLPWFGVAVVCAIPLLRRRREVHGALLLVGVVCIPLLFLILGEKHRSHESSDAEEIPSASAAPQSVAESQPLPFPATTPEKSQAPNAEPAPEVDFAHEYGDALVTIKGPAGAGIGFICGAGDTAKFLTNTHVIADVPDATVTRMDGAAVIPGSAEVAAGRDVALIDLPKTPDHALEVITDFDNNVHVGDAVVILGNSEGGGGVTRIDGKIVGIGADRVEVSAEFVPADSGSPIIHAKTGQVIGIAAYPSKRYDDTFGGKSGTAPAPRFGYRIDNVATWERVDWNDFRSDAALMRQISALTGDIFDFLGSERAKQEPNFATETLRDPATEWRTALQTKPTSDSDRENATRGFLNSLRAMTSSDATAAEPHLHYTYFREELQNERRIRDLLCKSFDEESAKLSEPANSPPVPKPQ